MPESTAREAFDLIVVGAGPAGSTLAARMVASGKSVLLLEQHWMPRRKLCGEFLSPEALVYLADAGLRESIIALNAPSIRSVRFEVSGTVLERPLPAPGLGVTRSALDSALFEAARLRGVVTREGWRVRAIRLDESGGAYPFNVEVKVEGQLWKMCARAVIDAAGRHPGIRGFSVSASSAPPASPNNEPRARPSRFVALARHYAPTDVAEFRAAREAPASNAATVSGNASAESVEYHNPDSESRVEIYPFSGGYCGINPVEGGLVNVCLLARSSDLRRAGADPEGLIEWIADQNPAFAARYGKLVALSEGFQGASGFSILGLRRFRPPAARIAVGDAAGMIAPLCGDGMSMAIRSSELAARELDRLLSGATSWQECRERYWEAWRREFGARLRIAAMLQEIVIHPASCRALLRVGRARPGVADWLIRSTRDAQRAGATPRD